MAISKTKGNGSTKRKVNFQKNTRLSRSQVFSNPAESPMNDTFFGSEELQDLFKKYTGFLKQTIDFDRASIVLLEKDNENVTLHGIDTDGPSEITLGTQISKESSNIWKVIQSEKVFFSKILKPNGKQNNKKFNPVESVLYKEGIRCYVIIPLFLGKKPVGTLNLGRKSNLLFTHNDIEKINPYLFQLAMGLENIRLKEHHHSLLNRIDALSEISRLIVHHGHDKKIFPRITALFKKIFHCDQSMFLEWNPLEKVFIPIFQEGYPDELENFLYSLHIQRSDMPLAELVFTSDKAIVVQDTSNSPLIPNDLIQIFNPQSYLCMPMRIGKDTIGCAFLIYSNHPHRFTEEEIQLATEMITHVTMVFENSRLFDKHQKQSGVAKSLLSVSQNLTEILSMTEVMERMVTLTRSLIHCDYFIQLSWNQNLKQFIPVYMNGIAEDDKPLAESIQLVFPHKLLAEKLYSKRLPLILEQIKDREIQQLDLLPASWIELTHVKSAIFLPLISKDKLLGAIHLGYTIASHLFTEEEILILTGFAQYTTIAIENAYLLSQEQLRTRELETLNEIGQSVSSITNPNNLFQEIYEQVRRIIPCDSFYIATYNPYVNKIQMDFLIDEGKRYEVEMLDIGKGDMIEQVVADGKPRLINRHPEENHKIDSVTVPVGNVSRRSGSLIFVPMKKENRVVGIISAQSYKPNIYHKNHLELLTTIASQAMISLDNARYLDDQRKYIQRLELIANVSASIASTTSLQERLEKITNLVREALSVDLCVIRELDGEQLQLMACTGIDSKDLLETIPSMYGIAKVIIQTQKPISIYDVKTDPLLQNNPPHYKRGYPFRSYLGVPMILNNEMKGIIGIYMRNRLRAFTPIDAEHLQIIAEIAVVAIENARLFAEKERVADRLQALVSISEVGLTTYSVDDFLQKLIIRMVNVLKADAGSILMVDESGHYLRTRAYIGLEESIATLKLKMGEGIAGLVASENRVIDVRNIHKDNRTSQPSLISKRIISTLGAPIRINGKVIGVAHIDSYKEREFTDWDISLFELLTARAGLAIENIRLYRESQKRAESLLLLQEAMYRELGIMDLPELYKSIVKVASGLVGADLAALPLINEDKESFTYAAAWGDKEDLLEGKTLALKEGGLCGWVYKNREPILVADLKKDPRAIKNLVDELDINTALIVPLIREGNIFGGISLYRKGEPYSTFDLHTLILFSNQAALSIYNAKLFSNIQETEEKYRNLFEHANDAIYVHSLDGRFIFVNKAMEKLTGFSNQELTQMNIRDLVTKDLKNTSIEELSIYGENIDTRIPLELIFYRKDGTQRTIEINIQQIRMVGQGVPIAVQGIARDATERKRQELRIFEILEVTRHIRSTLKLDDVLNRILEGATRLIMPKKYYSISLMLIEEDSNELVIRAAYGLKKETIRDTREKVGNGIAGWVAQNGESLLVKNIREHPVFGKKYPIQKVREEIISAISVPLRVQEKIIGVMNIASTEEREEMRFDEHDLWMMEMMANNVAIAIEKSQLYEDLENQFLESIRALARAVDAKDSYTMDHSQKTAEFAVNLAMKIGLSDSEIHDIETAAVLHDVGKIGVRDSILLKPGKLTVEEYDEMKKHPELGAKILEPLQRMKGVANLVLYHQERFDGKGYPAGLVGDEIPIGCRILAVVDAYQAMTSDRVYRKALTEEKAIEELLKNKGTQFDPNIVDVFLDIIQTKEKNSNSKG